MQQPHVSIVHSWFMLGGKDGLWTADADVGISCMKCGYVYSIRFQRIKSCRAQWHLDITIAFAELPCNATSVGNIYDGKCPSPWSPCFWLFGGSSDESFIIPLFLEACFANLQLRTPKKIKQQLCKIYWTTKSLNWRMWQKFCCTLPWFCFDPWYVCLQMFRSFCQPNLRNLMSKRSGRYFPSLPQTTRAKLPMKCWKNISVHQLCESTLKVWIWMCQTHGLSSNCWTRMEVLHKLAKKIVLSMQSHEKTVVVWILQ